LKLQNFYYPFSPRKKSNIASRNFRTPLLFLVIPVKTGIREKEHKTLNFQRKFKEHFIYFLKYFLNLMLKVSASGFPVKLGMTRLLF